jgi:hypothetical protein
MEGPSSHINLPAIWDLNRMKSNCRPPFNVDGVEHRSYLCKVGRYHEVPYFTFVYAPDLNSAIKKMDEEYGDFERRELINK